MTTGGNKEALLQSIEQRLGRTLAPPVRHAFLQIPRGMFVQHYYEQQGNSLSWDFTQATADKIYRDEALVTQIDDRGMPSSSTSQPSVMAIQLEALALKPGQTVLEIGVGTGYNAALLAALVGETGQVISIDIDERLVEQAQQHLTGVGLANVIVLSGDGFLGESSHAPYDRILSTCSIRSIPQPWFEQLMMGGRVVANWLTHLASLFICVEKSGPDQLEGSFLDLYATYMEMHARDLVPAKQKINWQQYDTQSPTRFHLPGIRTMLQNPAYSLLLQCFVPEMRKRYRSQGNQVQVYLIAPQAVILIEDNQLLIFGDAGIGQPIQKSFDVYHQLGQPHITAYRVIVQAQKLTIHIGAHHFTLPLSPLLLTQHK